ncbi:unnamed protein product (macronuclear) [Paramecium tetraurelia]|uniref:Uncharacterized protein n=1 Tax=Paramecium tetraurelia TaxID=5888 RepID=A0CW04_PARTE|nr:uncharacterized protein GSPATT00001173001 [Paramecium tetraurelia]CAK74971.1 unnamed protein product [Paramecium tetraurelia]|eukprot:XP_001442368.1 hypothetical protein (macronuclear) [Paramecium tetraurelia strain d4-2]
MSNMLSEQLKTQYKSKSVYWRQEKEKLLQTFQPRQNNSQSQQRSRTSERKSIIRNLVDSLYNQGTPEKNKSIYYQFQSQITQQKQQQQCQSSAKKQHTDELTLSTIINKYQRQVENCNQKQVVYDPIAEQIIESFQELKNRSVKKSEMQKCQSEQKIIENSAHKQNIFSRINQIREFIDQQLGTNADESNKDIKYESQYQSDVDQSSGNLRNKSVEFRQFLDQRVSVGRDSTNNRLNHRINRLRSIRSCQTLDVGIQVSLQDENLMQLNSQRQKQQQESYQQFNDQNNSQQNYQQQKTDRTNNSRRNNQEQYEVQNTQQQTSPQQSHNPYYQVEQSVTSEYQLPLQQMLQQQYQNEDSIQKSKNSGRMSRRSEFLQKARYSTNVNDENKERFSVNIEEIKKERFSENERFSVTSNEINGKDGILANLDFNKERFSVRSNEQNVQNKVRNSIQSNFEEDFKDKLILKLNKEDVALPIQPRCTNKENVGEPSTQISKINKNDQEQKLGERAENKLNTIEIPKIIQALNFDNIELSKPCNGTQISVDTNRFQLEIQQIMEKQNETQDVQLKQNELINIQQDFALTTNRSQLSVPITEPTYIQLNNQINTNFIRVEEEIEAGQPDIRIIENATGITECNLQYSEDTANLRIPTQISNNEEVKFKPDSYVTCDIQFQQIKQDYQQLNQLQSTQSNQMNQSSFEQWLSQTDQNKRIFNFNCQSQYFQKEKCDHSTQINKSESDSDEEIQFIKKKQQKCQFNQGVTLLVRKITSILKIRQIKSFYEIKEYSLHQSQQQQQQQLQQFKSSLHTYQSPIESQYSSQFYSQQQSLTSLPMPSVQTQFDFAPLVTKEQAPQATKEQAAQEKISNLLKTIIEETGSDTLRMLKNKSNLSPVAKTSEKKRLNSRNNSRLRISKKCSTASILTSMQSPVQEINDRIKVNFIQEMGLESPTQKHTEHAELHDCSPIAEPMEFQDVSVLMKQRREMKQIADSNNGSNIINNSYNDQRHCQILSHHIAIQKAKIAKKFQQIHYKTAGQQQFRKENYQI